MKDNKSYKKAVKHSDEFAEMDGYTAESRAGEILLEAGIEGVWYCEATGTP